MKIRMILPSLPKVWYDTIEINNNILDLMNKDILNLVYLCSMAYQPL